MDTTILKTFAQKARTDLIHQVGAQLKVVLAPDSLARREELQAVVTLENQIEKKGEEVVVDEVAYTWFNRFCALRFMDVNHYNKIGIVSPSSNQIHPEILTNAMNGLFDGAVVNNQKQERIFDLLNNRIPSRDAQGEVYRILLVSYCNALAQSMEFLFKRITDYTELLLPTNLLAVNSILADCRIAMTEQACKDVEVIGWLYQYYISERKDEVFAGFKKRKKAGARDIPAATQLFTPHWIVQYLLDNSLGRLWMLNNPNSRLIDKMEYYIKPEEEETDFLRVNKPEEIKVCDPACGSGHMLTYAFDLLYAVYEEEGYDPAQIPVLILENNLYGMEIDRRAADLAAFALMMKARRKSRSFLNKGTQPNIKLLENIDIDAEQLKQYIGHVGNDLFTPDVHTTIGQFKDADLFGSLIVPELKDPRPVLEEIRKLKVDDELFYREIHDSIIKALEQAEYLSQKYHVVIANPPYMGSRNMNAGLANWVKKYYPNSKSDLCTCFIERNLKLSKSKGYTAMITMQSWMFLSSFEKLRESLLDTSTITSMAHLGARAFDSIGGEVVSTTSFVIENYHRQEYKGTFIRIVDEKSEQEKQTNLLEAIKNPDCGWFFRVSADNFKKIPGSPIAYWAGEDTFKVYSSGNRLSDFSYAQPGLQTSNNNKFIRFWSELSLRNIGFGCSDSLEAVSSNRKWFPYIKGGDFRRWYGNQEFMVDWENNGKRIKEYVNRRYPYLKGNIDYVIKDRGYYFREGVTYSYITSALFNARYFDNGFLFDVAGSSVFPENKDLPTIINFLNSIISRHFLRIQNPTINVQIGDIQNLPFLRENLQFKTLTIEEIFNDCLNLSRNDWDSHETSWDFTTLPLLEDTYLGSTLQGTYQSLRSHWNEMTLEMQRLEEENNRIFIEAYGLVDELTPDVPLEEITLTCNPRYRYRGDRSDEELETLLLADTMKEFISYAVGCMFGRYSLDKPGLILANQGETYEDYIKLVPDSSFPAVKHNAIPILDGDWFADDIVAQFRRFLRATFGEANFETNLRFIEETLGKDVRTYFLRDFYNDHVRRYKKRPIYWMFSSPDGSFNVLIYMHRYTADTVSIVRNEYLREYMSKLFGYISNEEEKSNNPNLTRGERTRALKEITKSKKTYDTLEKYEQDVLFPLATQRIELDLDDGVRVNYPKFGPALKKITGLS